MMDNRYSERYLIFINSIAALMAVCICVRFSSAYFSYAAGLFVLFFLWEVFNARRNGGTVLPRLHQMCRLMIVGMGIFYGTILIDNLVLGDGESIAEGMDITLLALPFFFFVYLGGKYDIRYGIQWGVIIGSAVITLYGLYRGWAGLDTRYLSFFAHPNHFGTAIAMLWPFLGYYLLREKQTIFRLGLILLMALQLFCLYQTGSRGAVAAFAGGLLLGSGSMVVSYWKEIPCRIRRIVLAGVLVLCVASGAAFGIMQSERMGTAKIGGERIMMLEASYEIWQDHKILGVGLARWSDYYYAPQYHPAEGREMGLNMPHNMPVYFFTTAGIPGGMGYLIFLGVSAYTLYKTAEKTGNVWFSAAALAAFWAFTIQGMVDTTIINKIPARIYFMLMGYYLVSAWGKKENEQNACQLK